MRKLSLFLDRPEQLTLFVKPLLHMSISKEIKEHYQQLLYALHTYPQACLFIIRHKLWAGFWKYSWVGRLLLLAAILVGLKFISSITNWFETTEVADPLAAMSAAGSLFVQVLSDEYEYLSNGSMRYLMIILLEVVIFHMCRRTISILTDQHSEASMKAFIDAQVRMIKVVVYCYVMEMILGIGIKMFFGFFEFLAFLKPVFLFLTSLFFLGYAIMDNYLEQFNFSIKESIHFSKDFIGIALGVGLVIQVLFMVPIFGTILAPMIAAVTASIAMYELTDLHLTRATPLIIQEDIG